MGRKTHIFIAVFYSRPKTVTTMAAIDKKKRGVEEVFCLKKPLSLPVSAW
jgi:hypothetical protein